MVLLIFHRWKALDSAALRRSSVSFFESDKSETAVSRWTRARTRAAKVTFLLSNLSYFDHFLMLWTRRLFAQKNRCLEKILNHFCLVLPFDLRKQLISLPVFLPKSFNMFNIEYL